MITNDVYRKVEGILYNHYKKKKKTNWIQRSLETAERSIRSIQDDLKNVNIDLECFVCGIDYSRDKIQNNNVTSAVESELLRATERLLNELKYKVQKKYKLKHRLRKLEEEIRTIELLLQDLTEEELQIVELKYGEELTVRQIERVLDMKGLPSSKTSIWRKKDKIVEYLSTQLE